MRSRIITISRQFGSGGRSIGRAAAEKLGIPCYDAELIEKLEEATGLSRAYIAERGEYASHGSWLASAFSDRDQNGHSVQDDLWLIQRQMILELAENGPCVIVGRCADYILREKADCLNVFVYSDIAKRIKRIVEQYGVQDNSPEKRLREKDKRRSAYYQFYTGMKWGNVQNYHIALTSGVLGIDACVEIITQLYGTKLCENGSLQ